MLTPAKIKNHHFDASGRNAYRADSVDSFFEEVAASYEQMFRENGEMYKKINLLAERLEEYRKDEDNIRNALVSAQRMSEQITKEAADRADRLTAETTEKLRAEKEKTEALIKDKLQKAQHEAAAVVSDANKKASDIIDEAARESKAAVEAAKKEKMKEEATLEIMKREVSKFKSQIMDAYKEQISLISKLPSIVYENFYNAYAEQEKAEADEKAENEAEVSEESQAKDDENVSAPEEESAKEAENINIDSLQNLIKETEDECFEADDAGNMREEAMDEYVEEALTSSEEEDSSAMSQPETEVSYEELDKMVDSYSKDYKSEETNTVEEAPADIPVSKEQAGFTVNLDKIKAYGDAEKIVDDDDEFDYLDEVDDDDDDDDDDGGISSKLKGFFRK